MRLWIIIGLIALILILGGIWAYLMLNGAPESVAEFRDNVFGSSSATPISMPAVVDMPPETPSERTVAIQGKLVQLTDRAVAGAVIAEIASSTMVRYVEKGTGHIYEVSLESGLEKRISNSTIPRVVEAVWSVTGDRVVLTTDIEGVRGEMSLGTLSTTTAGEYVFDTESIATSRNIAFSNTGATLYYTAESTRGGTNAYARNIKSGTITLVFDLPFAESVVLWDVWGGGEHYVFSRPALGFRGYVYKVSGNRLVKVDDGLTISAARPSQDTLLINKDSGSGPYSLIESSGNTLSSFLDIQTLKEKCAGATPLWCAANSAMRSSSFPIAWYQGSVSYTDQLWIVDPDSGESVMTFDPETIAREELDITELQVGLERQVIFRNKRDDSLWLFNPSAL